MVQRALMALDCGGGSGRCLLLDADRGTTWTATRRWRHPVAPDTGGWGLQLDTATLWRELGAAAREVLQRAGVDPGAVVGVAATGMRHGMVLLDGGGEVLWGVPNRDARAASQGMDLASSRGQELHERTGHWPSPIAVAARLLWLQEFETEIFARSRTVLSISDWITFQLCGTAAWDPSQAGETSLLDLRTRDWADDLFGALGLPRGIVPPVRETGGVAGDLTAAAAEQLGLRPGIPVAVGGADTQCGLLGSGVVGPGPAGVVAGTTIPIQRVVESAVVDPQARVWTGQHVVPGRWVLESNAGAAGQALDWLGEVLHPGEARAAARVAAEAALSPVGATGVTSTLGAELFHASQMGLPVANLTFSHLSAATAGAPLRHVARAVLEGLAYGVRANLTQLDEVAGAPARSLRLSGGLSRSHIWRRILADVTGLTVELPPTAQSSLLGAAIAAGVGAGLAPDLVEGAGRWTRVAERVEPDPAAVDHYRGLYDDWQRLRAAREEADGIAAELVMRSAAGDDREIPAGVDEAEPGFRPKILVTAPLDDAGLARLRALGEVEYAPYMESQIVLTEDDLVEALQGFQVLVTEVDIVDADSVGKLPDLRVVFCCRSNPVNVDVAACTAYGVAALNAPGRNAVAVAELTVALLLTLARKVVEADRFLHEPGGEGGDIARMGMAHERYEGFELRGKTVGLVGLGAVGRGVAGLLRAFGTRVLAHDPFLDAGAAARAGVTLVSLDELLRASDAVSLHAPVTDATRGMIGADQLRAMRPGAVLVNTARAALIDEGALLAALRSGHVGGAALDVFAQEPPGADHPLLRLPQVVALPHIAGNTRDVAGHQGAMVAEAVERLLRGEAPETLTNPETLRGFRWTGPRRVPSDAVIAALAAGGGPAVTDLEAEEQQEQGVQPADAWPAEAPAVEAPKKRGFLAGIRDWVGGSGDGEDAAEVPTIEEVPLATAAPAGLTGEAAAVRQRWVAIIEDFLGRVETDEVVRRFSAGKKVTVRYRIPDADLEFYTGFVGDPPRCGLEAPPGKPQLTLKMTAQVLDDVFMERISGMKAAMSGQMAFSGNTMKAMSLQRVQKDLNRLYAEAREQVGDPGDLTLLAAAAEGPAEPAAVAPSAPAAAARPRVGDERDEMADLIEELYAAHLITSTGGNVSIRRPGRPEEVWITPSAMPKGHIDPRMLVRVDLDGDPLDEDGLAPSSERLMHTAIYRQRPEVEAVIHSHAPKNIVLGLTGLPFLPVSTEAAFFGDIPRIPFQMPGSDELADAVSATIGDAPAVMLLNHGLLVAGSSLRRALDMTTIVEETSEALLDCHVAGVEPPVLPAEVLQMLQELGELIA